MDSELVAQLDEARERPGLKSRMELFRRSRHALLLEAGEVRVAEMFAPEELMGVQRARICPWRPP